MLQIVLNLYLLPLLNPKSYDGARVLEALGRPIICSGWPLALYVDNGAHFMKGELLKLCSRDRAGHREVTGQGRFWLFSALVGPFELLCA